MANLVPLQHGSYYHVYNRGNNQENLFVEERNYAYFIKLWIRYIVPIANTYAYCLMPNHFHFLVGIKDVELIPSQLIHRNPSGNVVKQQFSNLFNAYARTINSTYKRSGALFQRPFRRKEIKSDAKFLQLIAYIHQNPEMHGFVEDFRDWKYSSYHALINDSFEWLERESIFSWFGGIDGFFSIHLDPANLE